MENLCRLCFLKIPDCGELFRDLNIRHFKIGVYDRPLKPGFHMVVKRVVNILVHHTYPFGWLGVSSVDRGVAWAEHYYLDSG